MDPLVRAALGLQQVVIRGAGLLLSLGLGVYLVCWAADPPAQAWSVAALGLLLVSVAVHLVRRLRSLKAQTEVRSDLELFMSLTTGVYAAVLHLPGALDGAFYPAVYVLMMVVAAFARPLAAVLTVIYAAVLEAGLHFVAYGARQGDELWPHALFLALFTGLNVTLFRAEIARVRRVSRAHIAGEIDRMREAARSYRLLGSGSEGDDRDRLLRSGIDEIHQATQFALDLLRRTLKLQTAVLLGAERRGETLSIQEVSTDVGGIASGSLSAQGGIFGAALAKGDVFSFVGTRAGQHASYYERRPTIGGLCAVPILERGHLRGFLAVDRVSSEPFTDEEVSALRSATSFLQRAIENERVFAELERARSEQAKLYRAAGALGAAITEAQVIEAGVSSAREVAAFDFAAVTLFHRRTNQHEICAVSGEGADALVGRSFRHNAGLVSMVVANRHALPYRGEYDASRQTVFQRGLNPPPVPSLLILPLVVHERVLGTLVLGSEQKRAFDATVRPALEVLASHVAVSLSNARMVGRLEELATTDGLTGLLNKRTLIDEAERRIKAAERFSKPVSVLVTDIDHFKRVNDTYGHDVGDVVIKGLGEVLKRVKRDTDIVGRFGGEEFVVVCEQTDETGAKYLAERIRKELESTEFQTELGPLKVTCSVGVATFPAAGRTWAALFKATDEALYVSKRGGRNRVTAWSPKMQGASAA